MPARNFAPTREIFRNAGQRWRDRSGASYVALSLLDVVSTLFETVIHKVDYFISRDPRVVIDGLNPSPCRIN